MPDPTTGGFTPSAAIPLAAAANSAQEVIRFSQSAGSLVRGAFPLEVLQRWQQEQDRLAWMHGMTTKALEDQTGAVRVLSASTLMSNTTAAQFFSTMQSGRISSGLATAEITRMGEALDQALGPGATRAGAALSQMMQRFPDQARTIAAGQMNVTLLARAYREMGEEGVKAVMSNTGLYRSVEEVERAAQRSANALEKSQINWAEKMGLSGANTELARMNEQLRTFGGSWLEAAKSAGQLYLVYKGLTALGRDFLRIPGFGKTGPGSNRGGGDWGGGREDGETLSAGTITVYGRVVNVMGSGGVPAVVPVSGTSGAGTVAGAAGAGAGAKLLLDKWGNPIMAPTTAAPGTLSRWQRLRNMATAGGKAALSKSKSFGKGAVTVGGVLLATAAAMYGISKLTNWLNERGKRDEVTGEPLSDEEQFVRDRFAAGKAADVLRATSPAAFNEISRVPTMPETYAEARKLQQDALEEAQKIRLQMQQRSQGEYAAALEQQRRAMELPENTADERVQKEKALVSSTAELTRVTKEQQKSALELVKAQQKATDAFEAVKEIGGMRIQATDMRKQFLEMTYAPMGAQLQAAVASGMERIALAQEMRNAATKLEGDARQKKLLESTQMALEGLQQLQYVRRSVMEQMTAVSMGLPSGSYGSTLRPVGGTEKGQQMTGMPSFADIFGSRYYDHAPLQKDAKGKWVGRQPEGMEGQTYEALYGRAFGGAAVTTKTLLDEVVALGQTSAMAKHTEYLPGMAMDLHLLSASLPGMLGNLAMWSAQQGFTDTNAGGAQPAPSTPYSPEVVAEKVKALKDAAQTDAKAAAQEAAQVEGPGVKDVAKDLATDWTFWAQFAGPAISAITKKVGGAAVGGPVGTALTVATSGADIGRLAWGNVKLWGERGRAADAEEETNRQLQDRSYSLANRRGLPEEYAEWIYQAAKETGLSPDVIAQQFGGKRRLPGYLVGGIIAAPHPSARLVGAGGGDDQFAQLCDPITGAPTEMLTVQSGEYIVNREAAARHRPLLDRINSGTNNTVRAFEDGGGTSVPTYTPPEFQSEADQNERLYWLSIINSTRNPRIKASLTAAYFRKFGNALVAPPPVAPSDATLDPKGRGWVAGTPPLARQPGDTGITSIYGDVVMRAPSRESQSPPAPATVDVDPSSVFTPAPVDTTDLSRPGYIPPESSSKADQHERVYWMSLIRSTRDRRRRAQYTAAYFRKYGNPLDTPPPVAPGNALLDAKGRGWVAGTPPPTLAPGDRRYNSIYGDVVAKAAETDTQPLAGETYETRGASPPEPKPVSREEAETAFPLSTDLNRSPRDPNRDLSGDTGTFAGATDWSSLNAAEPGRRVRLPYARNRRSTGTSGVATMETDWRNLPWKGLPADQQIAAQRAYASHNLAAQAAYVTPAGGRAPRWFAPGSLTEGHSDIALGQSGADIKLGESGADRGGRLGQREPVRAGRSDSITTAMSSGSGGGNNNAQMVRLMEQMLEILKSGNTLNKEQLAALNNAAIVRT